MRIKQILAALVAVTCLCLPLSANADQDKIKLAYVEWAETVASTNVIKLVLEQAGYEVEIIPVSAAVMWTSAATGDVDGFTGGWLPKTQGQYLKRLKDQVNLLGPNLEGARIGLAVPTYVELDSIADLKENADMFEGRIIGIDPGAGIMVNAENAVEDYELDNFELMEGSGATMTAVLKNRIEENKAVVVTAWSPHWKFSRWDLKYLKDPEKSFGGEEYIASVARLGLEDDAPHAFSILDNFHWTMDECQQVMLWGRESSPAEAAARWVKENPERVAEWLAQ